MGLGNIYPVRCICPVAQPQTFARHPWRKVADIPQARKGVARPLPFSLENPQRVP